MNRVTLRVELKYSLSRSSQENVTWSSITAELLTASLNSTPTCYDEIVNELAQYRVFTTVGLKSAYHQPELNPHDRGFTAFQSGNALYQWRRLPFGLTNAVPEFQRTIDYIVRENDLKGCYPYLHDIMIAGTNQVEHDRNLQVFCVAALKANLTIDESKTQLSKSEISLLGYEVGYRSVQPDPGRVQPLLNFPYPKSA